MRLSEFIRTREQAIVAASVDFAAGIPALSGSKMTMDILRDHLPLILAEIAKDLEQPQTRGESILKSEGRGHQPRMRRRRRRCTASCAPSAA
jgi:hypothetical protein